MKIAFLFESEPTSEQIQAYKWVRARTGCAFKVEVEKIFETNLNDFNIIWWHYDKNFTLPDFARDENFKSVITDFLNHGGNLLLTLSAMKLLNEIEIEPIEPDFESFELKSEIPIGFVSFFGHPVFRKLKNGVDVFLAKRVDKFLTIAYVKRAPEKLRIVAVEKLGRKINYDKKILFEYENGGRVIAIGGNVYFSALDNPFFHNLDRLVLNSLLYLNNPKKFPEPRTYWIFSGKIEKVDLAIEQKALRTAHKKIGDKHTGLSFEDGQDFLVQGDKIYAKVSGIEIEQISIPPFQLIDRFKIYVKSEEKFISPESAQIRFKPESLLMEFEIDNVKFKETIFAHPKKPALILNFLITSERDFEICLEIKISPKILNLSTIPLKDFFYGCEEKLKCVYVLNDKLFALFLGSPKRFELFDFRVEDDLRVKIYYRISSGVEKAFNFAIVGDVKHPSSNEDIAKSAKEIYKYALVFAHKVFKENLKSVKDGFRKRLLILTPDEEFNRNFKIALSCFPKFVKNVKGLGNFLVDDLNDEIVDYGKVLQILPLMLKIGEYEIVRDTLEFGGRCMSLNGEIPSVLSLSGTFEYERDLRTEYIKVCAEYLRSSKDKLFAKFTWQRLKKMIENCKVADLGKDVVDSLLLFAKVLKDEAWIKKLSDLEVEEKHHRNFNKESFEDVLDVNSAISLGMFIGNVLRRYCIFDVDSFEKKIYFSPLITESWEFWEIRNLRIQNMRLNVSLKREGNFMRFWFRKKDLPEVKIIFEPRFEEKIWIEKVLIEDKLVENLKVDESGAWLEFSFRFEKEVKIFFKRISLEKS
ncbi:MAG: hypothetical protein RMJ81_01195 [Candidatus Kryptonium sp.]|nr:hypothetical protein [Candidatus Kryptonium sp.]MCX7762553.1 hypothetical protein [Candidatus Kryptonium sp.]MDW8108255.1 hypothetical protein [Candidatus Kryptonium sp.]